ncbi:MAG: ATP-binding protein [Anaerotignum faecicola]
MIYNLCDNAIRYNKEGGAVFVTLEQKADRISLTVRDTGIGIAKGGRGGFKRLYRVSAQAALRKTAARLRAFYCQTWCGTA